ncbi:hypothetical protein ABK040_016812 [Willaertia magna]
MDNRNSLQKGYDEVKDQVGTRKDAINESMQYSDRKDDTGEKVADSLVKPKEDVKQETWTESIKNAGISAYDTVANTLSSALDTVTGGTEREQDTDINRNK